MTTDELLAATRELARRGNVLEAELLVHLGEIDERRLYLDRAFSSMFGFCVAELGFSEGAAYNRIFVARAARRFPALITAVRSGRVHVTALRLLAPHLTGDNHAELVARAAGRTREQVAALVACLAPRPAPAAELRKLPGPRAPAVSAAPAPSLAAQVPSQVTQRARPAAQSPAPPPVVPMARDTYRLQLAISSGFREEIREAQALLRHRVPDGDLAAIFRAALARLVAGVKKERFAVGRQARASPGAVAPPGAGARATAVAPAESVAAAEARTSAGPQTETVSRHVPDALKRAVYERDGGRCTFVSEEGRRCDERGSLELDHLDGFARVRRHSLDGLRLLCRAHNQHAADQTYGRAFMDAKRTCFRTSSDPRPEAQSPTPGAALQLRLSDAPRGQP